MRAQCLFDDPPPEDVGVVGVDPERQRYDHFEAVQLNPAAVFVVVEAAHPALIKNAAFEDYRDVARNFRHEATEQGGDLVLGHPNRPVIASSVGGRSNHNPPVVYCDA